MMRETWVLLSIRLCDLLYTLALLHAGVATEGNPLAAPFLTSGPIWFLLLGLPILFAPFVLLEWCARRSARSRRVTVGLLRFAIGFYLGAHAGSALAQMQLAAGR